MKKLAIFEQAIPCTAGAPNIERPRASFMASWKNGGFGNWSNSTASWKNSDGWSNSTASWKNSYGWSNSTASWKNSGGGYWSNSTASWKNSGGWSNSSGGGK
ncbi:MAG: hypothetical protein IJE43_16605 [Alphaproteobacteria bacterium]|nr:hypothetical protein [Alphaproteobacteria bacterium]